MKGRLIGFVALSLVLHAAVLVGSLLHVTLPRANVNPGPMSVELVTLPALAEKPAETSLPPTMTKVASPMRPPPTPQPTPATPAATASPTRIEPAVLNRLAAQSRALVDTAMRQARAIFPALADDTRREHKPITPQTPASRPHPVKSIAKPVPIPATQPAPQPATRPATQPTTKLTTKPIADAPSLRHAPPEPGASVQPGLPDAVAPEPAPTNPPPVYPAQARAKRQQGTVTLQLRVAATGEVNSVCIVQSSGFPLLDQAASTALARWRFAPATRGGKPESARITYPIRFVLKDRH